MKHLLPSLLLTGCTVLAPVFPAEDIRVNGRIHTLGFHSGSLEATRGLYDESFEVAAKKACANGPYTVTEKSGRPSTLKDTPGLWATTRFFWVVRCD